MSPRRVLAIAATTWRDFGAGGAAVLGCAVVFLVLACLDAGVRAPSSARDPQGEFLQRLHAFGCLAAILTAWAACSAVSRDRRACWIEQWRVTPLGRVEYVLGKVVGVVLGASVLILPAGLWMWWSTTAGSLLESQTADGVGALTRFHGLAVWRQVLGWGLLLLCAGSLAVACATLLPLPLALLSSLLVLAVAAARPLLAEVVDWSLEDGGAVGLTRLCAALVSKVLAWIPDLSQVVGSRLLLAGGTPFHGTDGWIPWVVLGWSLALSLVGSAWMRSR